MPQVVVHVPLALRELTDGRPTLRLEADSVGEILQRLRNSEPLLAGRLFADDGSLRGFVNLFLDGADIGRPGADSRSISSGAEVYIVPSVAGG